MQSFLDWLVVEFDVFGLPLQIWMAIILALLAMSIVVVWADYSGPLDNDGGENNVARFGSGTGSSDRSNPAAVKFADYEKSIRVSRRRAVDCLELAERARAWLRKNN